MKKNGRYKEKLDWDDMTQGEASHHIGKKMTQKVEKSKKILKENPNIDTEKTMSLVIILIGICKYKIMKAHFNNGKYKFNFSFPTIIFAIPTAIIGHSIHGGFWWTLFDLLFWPFVWLKWLIYRDVNVTIIKNAFSWFLE